MRFQLLQQELVQHGGREKRLLIAKGFPDKNERHHGLPPGIQPESVQGIQRLLCGLVEGEVEQETAVVLPAALIGENVVLALLVQPVKAVVQRQVGAELAEPGGAVLAAAGVLPAAEQENDEPDDGNQDDHGKNSVHVRLPKVIFRSSFPYCNTTRRKL